jgi:PAS domain S-box-containing protein
MELQEVLENSPAMIYMKDPEGRYIFVNRRWTELLHNTTEGAQGRTDMQLFPPEAARQFAENDRNVMASGQTFQFEEQAMLSDGPHYYDSTKVALRNDQGKVYALCGISMDVTERKLKEESLRQVHRALRVLSQCNAAVVHATEEQALLNEVCRIAVGPAGYQLAWVGYTEHDEARTVRPVASAGPAEGFLDRIHVSWADNQYGRGSIGYAIRENRPVVVRRLSEQPTFAVWRDALATRNFDSVLAVPLSEQGSVFGALAIYAEESDAFDSSEVDLIVELGRNLAHGIVSLRARKERTEAIAALEAARAELEERVRQRTIELEAAKDAAESADRLKSAFLAVMSHELRTPLNSIIGFTGIVVQGLAGPLNEEQKKQLGMVQNSSRHLLALINDVLDISKIEAGQLEIHCSSFSLREVICQAVATVSPLAEKKGIALHTEIPPDAGDIISDQHRTRQILLNLVGNAVKFTDHGSVCVRCVCEEPWVSIAIQDTGIGIPPQHLKTIFEPFRQVDTGVARSREGTGLGLSICRRLVEHLGGFLFVESEPGVGSTFTVRLPRKWEVSRG